MKKSDLKKIIKPLVKECIHEVLLEEGLLSNVVSEVAKGMQANLIVEAAPANRPAPQKTQDNTWRLLTLMRIMALICLKAPSPCRHATRLPQPAKLI